MKKVVALALLCLGFAALSCEEEKLGTEEVVTSLKVVGNDTIDVYVGDTAYINVEYAPRTAPAPRLYCYGYNQLLMRAYKQEKNFMIIARERGTTIFNIGDHDSEASTICVINILPATFNLAHTERDLYVADTFTIKPILPPEIAKNTIRWESSKPSIASVSREGMVRALAAGECEISAVAYVNSDTLRSNKCRLTVRNMDISSLELSDTLKEVILQKTFRLRAICYPSNTTFTDYKWSSSNKKVATVDDDGLVVAVSEGSCIISAKDEVSGLIATCNVTVVPKRMDTLQLSDTKLEIKLWQKHVLGVSFEPDDASYQEMHWISSNEKVAKVTDGEVEAVGIGDCVITVTNKENGLTAKCDVTVYEVKMASLQLDETRCDLKLGKTRTLNATFEPTTTSYTDLYWSSSDEKVATVDNKGNVVAVGVGTCTVSVTNRDKSLTATCEMNVYKIEVTSISCLSEKTMEKYESFELSATYTYEPDFEAIEENPLRWRSLDETIAKVDELTGKVQCVGVGECTIEISNIFNSVTASCHLTVLPVSVKYLSLNSSSFLIWEGEAKKLICTVTPSYAANKNVKWESSDESVATVSDNGTVTAVSEGKATIKVTALDGSDCSAECVVAVIGRKYVENYIKGKVSIEFKGVTSSSVSIGEYVIEKKSYNYEICNSGDERVYLKEFRGDRGSSETVDRYIESNGTYTISFDEEILEWVFEIEGYEVTKR